eukprot:1440093-Amphidinium_carterae.1
MASIPSDAHSLHKGSHCKATNAQHGARMSSGADIMAERVDPVIDLDPSRLFVQVDVANAFSSAARRSTLEALRECSPQLALSQ